MPPRRYAAAPDFRRLALLENFKSIVRAQGAAFLRGSMDACLPILLQGIDSADAGVARAATDVLLVRTGSRAALPQACSYSYAC